MKNSLLLSDGIVINDLSKPGRIYRAAASINNKKTLFKDFDSLELVAIDLFNFILCRKVLGKWSELVSDTFKNIRGMGFENGER